MSDDNMEKVVAQIVPVLRRGHDITITMRQREDGRVGELIVPLEWARAAGARYDHMATPNMVRVQPSGGCLEHRGDPSPFCGSCEATQD